MPDLTAPERRRRGTAPDALLKDLRRLVGDRNVLVDADVTTRYRTDWTQRIHASSATVVRPGTTRDLAAVIALCSRGRVALVPQGGNTGLVGGAVPVDGELVISMERFTVIDTPKGDAHHVTAGAGATLRAVQERATSAGRDYAVDVASRDSATIGGTVATNAGGLRVFGTVTPEGSCSASRS